MPLRDPGRSSALVVGNIVCFVDSRLYHCISLSTLFFLSLYVCLVFLLVSFSRPLCSFSYSLAGSRAHTHAHTHARTHTCIHIHTRTQTLSFAHKYILSFPMHENLQCNAGYFFSLYFQNTKQPIPKWYTNMAPQSVLVLQTKLLWFASEFKKFFFELLPTSHLIFFFVHFVTVLRTCSVPSGSKFRYPVFSQTIKSNMLAFQKWEMLEL